MGPDDVNSTAQNISKQIGLLVQAMGGRFSGGSFTLGGGTTTVVNEPNVTSNSRITWNATNATAALTERTAGLYLSARVAASTFSISTQSGTTFGTETFNYVLFNPS